MIAVLNLGDSPPEASEVAAELERLCLGALMPYDSQQPYLSVQTAATASHARPTGTRPIVVGLHAG